MKKEKVLSALMAATMACSMATPALANDAVDNFNSDSSIVVSASDLVEGENFRPLTREEYLQRKADSLGISFEEAAADLDAKIAAFDAQTPSLQSWRVNDTEKNNDGTTTLYGTVYHVYTKSSPNTNEVLQVEYGVDAVMRRSSQGGSWIDCIEENTYCMALGAGYYDFEPADGKPVTVGAFTANNISVSIRGTFVMQTQVNQSYGFSELFTSSVTIGNTVYYREAVHDSFVQKANSSIK